MKILYIHYLYDIQESSVGANAHVQSLAEALNSLGHDVLVYGLNPKKYIRETSLNRDINIKRFLHRHGHEFFSVLKNGKYFFQELAILLREKPDVIMLRYNLFNFSLPVLTRILGVPLLLEVNAPMAFEFRKYTHVFSLPFISRCIEWINFQLSDRVYVVSDILKQYYVRKKFAQPDKIDVVPNGASVPPLSLKNSRPSFKFKDRVVIGFVGSFHYWHGIEVLEEIINLAEKDRDRICFLLVGDGPLRQSFESRIHESKFSEFVFFSGYVPQSDLSQYLFQMHVGLAPYPHSDFFYFSPLKIFEYMGHGVPVIASAQGQITQIITSGKNGVLCPAGDAAAFYQSIQDVVKAPSKRATMSREAVQTIQNRFGWQQTARLVLESILSIQKDAA